MTDPCENTDRELWREREGDYYANSIHVTKSGGIGIDVGGIVIVMPLERWVAAAQKYCAYHPDPIQELARLAGAPSDIESPFAYVVTALAERESLKKIVRDRLLPPYGLSPITHRPHCLDSSAKLDAAFGPSMPEVVELERRARR